MSIDVKVVDPDGNEHRFVAHGPKELQEIMVAIGRQNYQQRLSLWEEFLVGRSESRKQDREDD